MPTKVKINIDRKRVAAKIEGAWGKGLPLLSEEILTDCNEFVKVASHTLEQSAIIHSIPAEGKLIWQTPYARRQYWEIQTAHHDINPNATWKWCEVAKKKYANGKWQKQAQKLVEMNL